MKKSLRKIYPHLKRWFLVVISVYLFWTLVGLLAQLIVWLRTR